MSSISVAGDVSGAISIAAPSAAGSGVLTLPTGTDTLVGKATTDTLTNKSIAATQLTGTIAAAALPAGSVLQVVSTTKTSVFSSTAVSTWTDITGLTVSITPSSTSNKILVSFSINAVSNVNNIFIRLVRNSTAICIGDAASTRTQSSSGNFYTNANSRAVQTGSNLYLDSPSTVSATTYKLQFLQTGVGTVYVNQAGGDTDGADATRTASTITVQEIAG
jgi:hypothetical protein